MNARPSPPGRIRSERARAGASFAHRRAAKDVAAGAMGGFATVSRRAARRRHVLISRGSAWLGQHRRRHRHRHVKKKDCKPRELTMIGRTACISLYCPSTVERDCCDQSVRRKAKSGMKGCNPGASVVPFRMRCNCEIQGKMRDCRRCQVNDVGCGIDDLRSARASRPDHPYCLDGIPGSMPRRPSKPELAVAGGEQP